MVKKSNVSNLVKNSHLNKKFESLATKEQLIAEQDKMVKMRTRVLSYLLGKNDFGEVFQIMIVYKPTINTL